MLGYVMKKVIFSYTGNLTLYLNTVKYDRTILRQLCDNPGARLVVLVAAQRGRAEAWLLNRCRFLNAVRYMVLVSSSSDTRAEPT